jgi:predicted phage terminase large subunit-like protein
MIIDNDLEVQLKREIYKESYYEFFKWAFNILEPQTLLEDAFHIKYLCDLLQAEIERIRRKEEKDKDIIINIPPRTSKSKILSQALLAWVWIDSPHLKMISVSYSEKLAISNSKYCKDIIKSDEYQQLYGHIYQIRRDIDSAERYANDKGGERLTTTVSGTITGFGAEIICVDDPQDPKTAESESLRESVIKYWTETLFNRLTPINLGIRILLQQRLHVDDLTGFLLKNTPNDFFHVCLPAEADDNVRPIELKEKYVDGLLDPVRLGRRELVRLKGQGGSRYYVGQYQQRPVVAAGGIFKKDWFDIVEPSSVTRDLQNEPIHFFMDSAYTSKEENDPSAILTCFRTGNFLYVVDAQERWLEFPELIKHIKGHTKSYQLSSDSKMFIEPKASGKSIVQQLRTDTMLNVVETKPPDKDKVTRANAVTPICESKRVRLINGPYVSAFLDHLGTFPFGKHDDMADTLVMALDQLMSNSDAPDFFFV